ncbi:SAM-dependent methyltransferase [Nonomuraea sp. KC401]|uniref:SAM-dependent methyltransferase n=1 Tax=unclassified Nonomuraea TaxID=2593643 RepID=UPI0010FEF0E9|nr:MULTISPECIES: SAM-dependent methyltransferase [unclassified Nonomuraea]NBE95342.1 SAM-dependent methyltransferase [Nonomuraea sp. K271]TLF72173.1 SAM-dependent methyltransferase [Nonomuraea sp. KC401]
MAEGDRLPPGINPHVPSVARMYDYYLGGRDNFPADREAAEKMIGIGRRMGNDTRQIALANRAFLRHAVRTIAEAGVRQFVDIGAGLPTQDNVHQVAHRHAPGSRVVYVDNDPIVLSHARALLARDPDVIAVEGDVRDPDAIFDDPAVTGRIDLAEPYAVLLVAVLHFVPDDGEAAGMVARIKERLPPGGHLVLSHLYAGDATADATQAGQSVYRGTTAGGLAGRDRDQITGFFGGLALLGPGVVPVADWAPDASPDGPYDYVKAGILAGVGRA